MSNLLFVRHAQASLFADDYDQLSEQGFRQSALLGDYLAAYGAPFDQIFVGPRRRHRQTAETALPILQDQPERMVEIPELDEHQVDRLVSNHAQELGKEFPAVAQCHDALRAAETNRDRRRAFAMLFEAVATLWVNDQCPLFGIESWSDFCARVNAGIDKMTEQTGRGQSAIAFTSAGTLGVTLHRALNCPSEVALGLGWRVWNCSLTGYAFSRNRFTLDQFNALPHMPSRDDWTYR